MFATTSCVLRMTRLSSERGVWTSRDKIEIKLHTLMRTQFPVQPCRSRVRKNICNHARYRTFAPSLFLFKVKKVLNVRSRGSCRNFPLKRSDAAFLRVARVRIISRFPPSPVPFSRSSAHLSRRHASRVKEALVSGPARGGPSRTPRCSRQSTSRERR